MAEIKVSSESLFARLVEAFKGNPEYQQRVVAHIRETHGHATLPSFHRNGATEQEKIQTYGKCLGVIVRVKRGEREAWSELKGQVPVGQAISLVAEPQKVEVSRDSLAESRAEAEVPEKKPEPNVLLLDSKPTANSAAGLIEQAMRLMGNSVNPEQVRDIVKEEVAGLEIPKAEDIVKSVEQKFGEIRDELSKKVDEFLANVPPRNCIEVKFGDEVRKIEGNTHWQLPQLITWVAANVPVWAHGPAGGGKTTLGYQIGDALNLPTFIASIDPTTTIGKLLGFRNLANGEFVEGWLYKPYKNGGLVMLDEIDTGDPGILAALNALLANDKYLFPNGEVVQRHEKFRVLAGANTKGCGAVAGYTARNRLDAATLDRFAIVELEYDEPLERAIATGAGKVGGKDWKQSKPADEATVSRWVDYVVKVRKQVGTSVLVSPRASILGARALRAGVPPKEVTDACLFKLVSADTKQNIVNSVGEFEG